jgi:hypothetical protein
MAVFDPEVQPLNDQDYTRASRGVDVPRTPSPDGQAQNQITQRGVDTPDRSAEYLGKAAAYSMEAQGADKKGFGDLFANVVGIADYAFKGADFMIKQDIQKEVYDRANQEREEYTARLEGMLGGKTAKSNSLFDANAQMTEDDALPGELEGLPDTLGQLKGAQEAGKISNTYYTGKLLAHAKDLRARHPMYREYIDQQFASVTGMNPANARITALSQDINRAMTAGVRDQRKAEAEVWKRNGWANNGVNSVQALQKVQSGEWKSIDVANWAYGGDKLEADAKMKDAAWKGEKIDRERRSQLATDAATSFLAGESIKLTNNLMAGFGVKDVNELRLKLKEDKDPRWWQDRVVELEFARDQFDKKMFAAFNHKEPGQAFSLAQAMNLKPAEIREYIKQHRPEFDSIIESVRNKDANGVAGATNRIKAKEDAAVEYWLNEPGLREFAIPSMAAKRVFGENNMVQQAMVERVLKEQFGGKFAAGLNAHAAKLRLGAASGVTASFNETFTDLKARGALTRTDANKLVNIVSDLSKTDIPDEEKYSIAKSAFGEANLGFVSRIAAEYQDADGRRIEGPWGVFEKWTAPDNVKEIKRLDGKYPGLWKDYTTWAEKTLTSDLLPTDIQTLNRMDGHHNFEVQWRTSDNGVRQIKIVSRNDDENTRLARHAAGGKLAQENDFKRVEQRFNSALMKFSNVAKEQGQDADAYILRTLYGDGGAGNLLNKGLFSDKILQSLKASRVKEELNKKK